MARWIQKWGILFIVALSLTLPTGVQAKISSQQKKRVVEVVFVLDTTGSMSGLIDAAKKKIWSIANTIIDQNSNAEVRMGLIGYRDIGDEYVVKKFPLTTDIQTIYGHLLTFVADGGGDTPESVNEALDTAVSKMDWSPVSQTNVDRIIFLVGDAPPHMDYKNDRKYPDSLKEAVQKKITVNSILAGDDQDTERVWREIAQMGKGKFLAIPQDGGTVVIITTPYDEEIRRIQIELNKTVIPYGSVKQQSDVSKKMAQYESAAPSDSAEMSKFVNKKGRGKDVVTGKGDLITDSKNKSVKAADVPVKDLPTNMQKMKPAERETYVKEQTAKRDALAAELAAKITQRDEYIAKESAKEKGKTGDSFDQAVEQTLRMQISPE